MLKRLLAFRFKSSLYSGDLGSSKTASASSKILSPFALPLPFVFLTGRDVAGEAGRFDPDAPGGGGGAGGIMIRLRDSLLPSFGNSA